MKLKRFDDVVNENSDDKKITVKTGDRKTSVKRSAAKSASNVIKKIKDEKPEAEYPTESEYPTDIKSSEEYKKAVKLLKKIYNEDILTNDSADIQEEIGIFLNKLKNNK